MKRSHMLSQITYTIKEGIGDELTPYEIAEAILEMQEEDGMLPPTTYCGHIGVQDNSWEKE